MTNIKLWKASLLNRDTYWQITKAFISFDIDDVGIPHPLLFSGKQFTTDN